VKKKPPGRPQVAERRVNAMQVRMTDRELERFQKQAGFEPLAGWARRILLEHCERRERRGKVQP